MENAKKMIVIPSVSEGSLNTSEILSAGLFEKSAIGGYIAFLPCRQAGAIDSSPEVNSGSE